MPLDDTGKSGESAARQFLEARGLVFRAANVRSPFGEIDIVMENPKMAELVFVEVKTRRGIGFGSPQESVTAAKLAKLRSLVEWYRRHIRWAGHVRLDVVGVLLQSGREPDITHIPYVG